MFSAQALALALLPLAALPEPSSAEAIGWLALAAGGIAILIVNVLKITDRFKESPPAHTQYASKSDHAELKRRVDEISAEIRGGFEKLDHKRSVSIAGLHDDLKDAVAELRTEIKTDINGVHERLTDIVGAIGELKGRTQK